MPIYVYRCADCGHQQEHLLKMGAATLTDCPACGKAAYRKMVTAAGFHLKGSGWYATDFKHGEKPQAKPEDTPAQKVDDKPTAKAEEKPSAKADEKPAAKADGKPAAAVPAKKADAAAPATAAGTGTPVN